MIDMSYAGIDIGTNSCKMVVSSKEGVVLFQDACNYDLILHEPLGAELCPDRLWNGFLELIKRAASVTNTIDPIRAISFSVLGEAVTPVDKGGQPLFNTLVSMDYRGAEEIQRITENKIDSYQIYLETGQICHPMYTASKLLWWKNRVPEIYQNTWKFLCWEDFLLLRLCGRPVISYSLASRTMLFNPLTRSWSHKMIEALDFDIDKLPEPFPSGTVVGPILPEIHDLTGLPKETLLVTGAWDQACALLGAGILSEGEFLDSFGTTICVGNFLERPLMSKELFQGGYQLNCLPKEGYFLNGGNLNGGILLKWFRDNIKREFLMLGKDFFSDFLEKLPLSPAHSLFIPHFSGSGTPAYNPRIRGAVLNLDYQVDDRDLLQALLESLCFEINRNILFLEEHLDRKFEAVKVIGGGSQSEYLCSLKANVFGKKTLASNLSNSSAFGALFLAVAGVEGWEQASNILRKFYDFRDYQPNFSRFADYQKKYLLYEEVCKRFEKHMTIEPEAIQ